MFLLFFIGTFTGRLTDVGLFRPVALVGSILVVLGSIATSFSTQYWQIFFSQGVCVGLGNGCLFCPTIALVSTYFQKRRSLAIGFTAGGSTTGGVLYPAIVRQLLPLVGFGWTMRAIGLVQLVALTIALLSLRPRLPPRTKGQLVEWGAFKELEYTFHGIGMFLVHGPVAKVPETLLTHSLSAFGALTLSSSSLPPTPEISWVCLTHRRWMS